MSSKIFKYQIFKEKNLIIKFYRGKFSIKDIFQSIEQTVGVSSPTMNAFNDLRNAEIIFSEIDVEEFTNKLKTNQLIYAQRKVAFLIETPNHALFTELINLFKKESLITLQMFSTIKSAAQWLEVSAKDVEDCLRRLQSE